MSIKYPRYARALASWAILWWCGLVAAGRLGEHPFKLGRRLDGDRLDVVHQPSKDGLHGRQAEVDLREVESRAQRKDTGAEVELEGRCRQPGVLPSDKLIDVRPGCHGDEGRMDRVEHDLLARAHDDAGKWWAVAVPAGDIEDLQRPVDVGFAPQLI